MNESVPETLTPRVEARSFADRFRVPDGERFSCYSHAFAALMASFGTAALIVRTAPGPLRWATVVYAIGTLVMFGASALYHAQKRAENERGLWRRIDHAAVFLMIAGTYTPVCYVHLPATWFWSVVGVQWGLAAAGIAFKFTALGDRRWLGVSIYLAMGWMALIPLPKLVAVMSPLQIVSLTAGGLGYTIGAVVYALKRPNPWPETIGFHGVWHLFVIAGALAHFVLVASSV